MRSRRCLTRVRPWLTRRHGTDSANESPRTRYSSPVFVLEWEIGTTVSSPLSSIILHCCCNCLWEADLPGRGSMLPMSPEDSGSSRRRSRISRFPPTTTIRPRFLVPRATSGLRAPTQTPRLLFLLLCHMQGGELHVCRQEFFDRNSLAIWSAIESISTLTVSFLTLLNCPADKHGPRVTACLWAAQLSPSLQLVGPC
jgi:hypothetical protein